MTADQRFRRALYHGLKAMRQRFLSNDPQGILDNAATRVGSQPPALMSCRSGSGDGCPPLPNLTSTEGGRRLANHIP